MKPLYWCNVPLNSLNCQIYCTEKCCHAIIIIVLKYFSYLRDNLRQPRLEYINLYHTT